MHLAGAIGFAFACAGCSRIFGFQEVAGSDGSVGPPIDTVVDGTEDAPPSPLESRFVDSAVTTGNGATVTLAVPATIPTSTFLVVEVAVRGNPPVSISDTVGHTWVKDAEIGNTTGTSAVAIFHVLTTNPLTVDDAITATVGGGTSDRARGLALFELAGATVRDQVGTAQDSTAAPSVSTEGALTGDGLAFGVIVTGFNSPVTFVPEPNFVEAASFAANLSSGSFTHAPVEATPGQPATFVTTASTAANFALALVTFR